MKNWIPTQSNCVHYSSQWIAGVENSSEFTKKRLHPQNLYRSHGQAPILGFSTRSSNQRLLVGPPSIEFGTRNKQAPEVKQ